MGDACFDAEGGSRSIYNKRPKIGTRWASRAAVHHFEVLVTHVSEDAVFYNIISDEQFPERCGQPSGFPLGLDMFIEDAVPLQPDSWEPA